MNSKEKHRIEDNLNDIESKMRVELDKLLLNSTDPDARRKLAVLSNSYDANYNALIAPKI